MATLTPKLGLKKPAVNVETDWGFRLNETTDILDDAVLTANTTGKGTVTVTDDGAGNLTISGSTTADSSNALVGADGITVTSGVSEDTITGFRTEFVNASGSLQSSIDAVEASDVDSVNALTGAVVVTGQGEVNVTVEGQNIVVSGTPHPADKDTVSDAIIGGVGITVTSGVSTTTLNAHLAEDAITGSDGITITSGTSTVDVAGFRTEFVAASGSLQTQIDAVEGSDVDSVNAVIGAVLVTGTNGVNSQTVGQTITLSAVDSEIDHGSLGGLGDDDHPQYSLVDGTRDFTGAVGGITPVVDADLATKGYVDTVSGGLAAEIDSDISTHAAIANAHHDKYTDAEAITALVPTTNALVASGVTDEANLVSVSGHLQSAIDDVEGSDVDSVNAVTGAVVITGTNGVNTATVGQTITVSAVDSEIDHGSIGGLGDDDHPQYGQLADAESASGVWDFSTNLTVTGSNVRTAGDLDSTASGTSGISLIGWPTLTAADVGTALRTLSSVLSAGHTSGGVITSGTSDNTIDISAGGGCIRKDNDTTSPVLRFGWTVLTGLALSTTAINYVGIEFNSGNPQAVTRTTYDWNFRNEFPLGNVVSVSGVLHIENASQDVADAPGQILERFFRTHPKDRDDFAGGLILSESADNNRNMAVSAGALWDRLTRFVISAVDTSASDTFDAFYFDGGTFQTEFGRTTWPNTQFNDITSGLVTMTNNRHAVLWFYLKVDGDLDMVYGTAQYTSEGAAEGEGEPSVPDVIAAQGTLIGRLIFQKNDTIAELVEISFERAFAGSLATDHGNLSGLADDDHTQYSLVDGTRAFTGTIGGVTPVADADLTTKLYVDTDTSALAASGISTDANIVSVSGHLQSEIDAVEASDVDSVNSLTGAIDVIGKGEVAVTVEGQNIVVSGTDHATDTDTDTVSDAIIGGVGIVVTSGTSTTTIDAHLAEDAITGSDGITIVSGTSTIDVAGFRTEFVNASGTLQTDIDTRLQNVVEDTTPQLGGNLDAQNFDITGAGNLTAATGTFSGDVIATTVTGTNIQSGGIVSAAAGNFSNSLTVSGLPVLIRDRDFVVGAGFNPDINFFSSLPGLSEALSGIIGPKRLHVNGNVALGLTGDLSEVTLLSFDPEASENVITLISPASVNRPPIRSEGVGLGVFGTLAEWIIDTDNFSPIFISDASLNGLIGNVFVIQDGGNAVFSLENVTCTATLGSVFNIIDSGTLLTLNLSNTTLANDTLKGPAGSTINVNRDGSSTIGTTQTAFSGTLNITNVETLIATTVTGTNVQVGETVSAQTGSFSTNLTVSGLPVLTHTRDFILVATGTTQNPDLNQFNNMFDLSEALTRTTGPKRVHVEDNHFGAESGIFDLQEVTLLNIRPNRQSGVALAGPGGINPVPVRIQGLSIGSIGPLFNWTIDSQETTAVSPMSLSNCVATGFFGDVFIVESGVDARFDLENTIAQTVVGSVFNIIDSGTTLTINLTHSQLANNTLKGVADTTINIRKDSSSSVGLLQPSFSGTLNITNDARGTWLINGGVPAVGANSTKVMSHGHFVAVAPGPMIRTGQIIGLSIGMNEARTAGTCQAQTLISGTAQTGAGETTDIDATNTTSNFVEISPPIAYPAGATVSAQTVTTGFSPTGSDATLYVFCEDT